MCLGGWSIRRRARRSQVFCPLPLVCEIGVPDCQCRRAPRESKHGRCPRFEGSSGGSRSTDWFSPVPRCTGLILAPTHLKQRSHKCERVVDLILTSENDRHFCHSEDTEMPHIRWRFLPVRSSSIWATPALSRAVIRRGSPACTSTAPWGLSTDPNGRRRAGFATSRE
jgi:hypothetical protein